MTDFAQRLFPRRPVFRRERLLSIGRAFASRWPLRAPGMVILGLGAGALWQGRLRIDLILTLAGLWTLLLLAVLGLAAWTASLVFARDLRLAIMRAPEQLAGTEASALTSGVCVPRRFWPLAAEPRWHLATPPGEIHTRREGTWRIELLRPNERGLDEKLVREICCEDLLALWRFRRRVDSRTLLRVLPNPGELDAARIQACLASGDLLAHPLGRPRGDRVDTRLYTRSDPARLILWKVYARSRELLVRAHEASRTPDARPLVYLVSSDADGAAAATARVLLDSGILGEGARFAADGQPTPVEQADAASELIVRSRDHRDRGGGDLAAALCSPRVAADDPVVLICPARADRWLEHVLGIVAADPARFLVLAAGDAAAPSPSRGRWEAWLWKAPAAAGPTSEQLQAELQMLVNTGARVVFLERNSGTGVVLGEGTHGALGAST